MNEIVNNLGSIQQIADTYLSNPSGKSQVSSSITNSFEDVLRKSISIGGDSDTIASIACGIAGAYYEIPANIKREAGAFITGEYREILDKFNEVFVRGDSYAEKDNSVR